MRSATGRTGPAPVVLAVNRWEAPESLLPAFSGEAYPVLLRSYSATSRPCAQARWSILAGGPFDRIVWSLGEEADPFDLLARRVEIHRGARAGTLPFSGGAIGYLSYDAGRRIERIRIAPRPADDAPRIPDLHFGLYPWAVLWDHWRRRVWIVSTGLPEKGRARWVKARDDARRLLGILEGAPRGDPPGTPRTLPPPAAILASSHSRSDYLDMVRRARRDIRAGEYYQVNLSQRLLLRCPARPDRVLEALGRVSAAPFSAYLDLGGPAVVSASPERFLSLRGDLAESRPIKGTAPRGSDPDEDDRRARELVRSEKDRAENVMIVDLVRNDLGRVCRPGSVRLAALCRLESYASVHHLVSIVRGRLARGFGRFDLIRALFPGGSMTGAPKPRAMQAIEDLEPHRRGLFAGSIGYLSFCGDLDLNIVIRTLLVDRDRAWLQVGGGIVADSRPLKEFRESLDKALSVRRAMGSMGDEREEAVRVRAGSPASMSPKETRKGSRRAACRS